MKKKFGKTCHEPDKLVKPATNGRQRAKRGNRVLGHTGLELGHIWANWAMNRLTNGSKGSRETEHKLDKQDSL
jgi:hypothetical protein